MQLELDKECQHESDALMAEVAEMRRQVQELQQRMKSLQPAGTDLSSLQAQLRSFADACTACPADVSDYTLMLTLHNTD